jgi:SAM-dependent methyltransferase
MVYGRDFEWTTYGPKTRERFFETGYKQVSRIAERIESFTDETLDSRRALDFGCGVGRLALPLAERCEYVYGLDVSPSVLAQADENAKQMNVTNVEWVQADRLSELSGRYDLVISVLVFQHIRARRGERTLAALLAGLRAGGVGVINMTLRPDDPLTGLLHWGLHAPRQARPARKARSPARTPMQMIRGLDWSYPYMLRNSYSLNRLSRVLAAGGITTWQAGFVPAESKVDYDVISLLFSKPL